MRAVQVGVRACVELFVICVSLSVTCANFGPLGVLGATVMLCVAARLRSQPLVQRLADFCSLLRHTSGTSGTRRGRRRIEVAWQRSARRAIY